MGYFTRAYILTCILFNASSSTDSIEANVESAAVHVEDGTEQLRQARDYQVKSHLN